MREAGQAQLINRLMRNIIDTVRGSGRLVREVGGGGGATLFTFGGALGLGLKLW